MGEDGLKNLKKKTIIERILAFNKKNECNVTVSYVTNKVINVFVMTSKPYMTHTKVTKDYLKHNAFLSKFKKKF